MSKTTKSECITSEVKMELSTFGYMPTEVELISISASLTLAFSSSKPTPQTFGVSIDFARSIALLLVLLTIVISAPSAANLLS